MFILPHGRYMLPVINTNKQCSKFDINLFYKLFNCFKVKQFPPPHPIWLILVSSFASHT